MSNETMTSLDVIVDIIKKNSDATALQFLTYKRLPWGGIEHLEELGHTTFRHNDERDEQRSSISTSQIDHASLSRMCQELPAAHHLALFSKVESTADSPKFIPMIDFLCAKSDKNLQLIASQMTHFNRIEGLKSGGFMLETDNSYHYIGEAMLPAES